MKWLLSFILFFSIGAKAQFCCVVSTSSPKDSARFQFFISSGIAQSGWTHVQGSPGGFGGAVISGTAGNNGTITWTTISNSTNNWNPLGSGSSAITSSAGNGESGVSLPNYAPNVMAECLFNTNASYISAYPQFSVGGLNPAFTYDIQMSAGLSVSVSATGSYLVFGATASAAQPLQAHNNTTTILTFPTVTPSSGGVINFYFNLNNPGTETVACISWIIITQH
jgi:hypothetical protein